MSESTSREMTILFADIAGSVELYASLGDLKAHSLIVHFLQSMTTQIERNQGRVVETIGDEIMCAFDNTNSALDAAFAVQDIIRSEQETALDVRVGFHSGLTGIKNGHPFGDTVNIAARVVALAKAGQIMLTDPACQRLSKVNGSRTRYFSEVYIKGKRTPYIIHQALWDPDDGTVMIQCDATNPIEQRHQAKRYFLRYRGIEAKLTEGMELLLGRGKQCGLIVDSEAASRIHATAKCQGGKLILTDRSTNGTFVKTISGKHSAQGSELFFHHDEWMTTSNAIISLGMPITNHDDSLIYIKRS